jgi:diacylglycerol kinase family enzyme
VEADGRRYRCGFALLSKVRNYGGDFEIARHVSLFDDEFEMVLFEGESSLRFVKYFAGLAVKRLQGMTGVTDVRARQVTLTGPGDSRVYVQIDGELAGQLPAKVEIVPDALTLLVPAEYERCHAGSMAAAERK